MPAAPCPRNHELRKTWYAQYAASAGDLVAAGDLREDVRDGRRGGLGVVVAPRVPETYRRGLAEVLAVDVRGGAREENSSSGRLASVSGRPIQPSTGALSVAGDATVPERREKRPAARRREASGRGATSPRTGNVTSFYYEQSCCSFRHVSDDVAAERFRAFCFSAS